MWIRVRLDDFRTGGEAPPGEGAPQVAPGRPRLPAPCPTRGSVRHGGSWSALEDVAVLMGSEEEGTDPSCWLTCLFLQAGSSGSGQDGCSGTAGFALGGLYPEDSAAVVQRQAKSPLASPSARPTGLTCEAVLGNSCTSTRLSRFIALPQSSSGFGRTPRGALRGPWPVLKRELCVTCGCEEPGGACPSQTGSGRASGNP